jgi:hypothetical protein
MRSPGWAPSTWRLSRALADNEFDFGTFAQMGFLAQRLLRVAARSEACYPGPGPTAGIRVGGPTLTPHQRSFIETLFA